MIANIVRALRLSFVAASVLPFVFGSLIRRQDFSLAGFFLGLIAVIAAHLSANLINDYCDSESGSDEQDKRFYGFFGGSKLIQEKVFSPAFYLKAAILCSVISSLCVILLAVVLNSPLPLILYPAVLFLGWSYSAKPLQLSYHRLGEVIIFILFGPVPVMAGYFIQTRIFPDALSFLLSLPFGFLTTAILFANEIPDFSDDVKAKKFTWVSLTGPRRAFWLYYLLIISAFLSILLNIGLGYLRPPAFFSLIFILPALKAASILKEHPGDKMRLIESSRLTIAIQALVSLILILGKVL